MKTKQEVLEYCASLPGVYVDYPFDEKTPVVRHRTNRKVFALFTSKDGVELLNVKAEPMKADFWRGLYEDVLPGYHMNKTHWNSLRLAGNLPQQDLLAMIQDSYLLTKPRKPKI